MEKIRCSTDVAGLVRERMANLIDEELAVITLNAGNKVINVHYAVTKGDNKCTVISVRQIARIAVLDYASGVVLVHNHPSGNPHPSKADITETEKVKKGLNTLDISLMDHVVIGDESYFSFADNTEIKF